MYGLLSVLESVMLVAALSVDAFVASFGYGTNKIKIPFRSSAIIDGTCTAFLAVSLLLGSLLRALIPPGVTETVCFIILFLLGLVKLCDSLMKDYIRKRKNIDKEITFSALNLKFFLRVYADPETADRDLSRVLSPAEALPLAIALSLDSIAVGFGAALTDTDLVRTLFLALLFNALAVRLGCILGNKIAEKVSFNLSWLSGLLLIILAVMKLF